MKLLSAILFASSAAVAGFLGEIWHMHRIPDYFPVLGLEGAAVGLILFGLLYAAMIYAYGAVSRAVRKKEEWIGAYALSAAVGIPFWFVLLALHRFSSDKLGLPDASWWVESALMCGVSFEIIRLLCVILKKRPNQAPEPTAPSGRGSS